MRYKLERDELHVELVAIVYEILHRVEQVVYIIKYSFQAKYARSVCLRRFYENFVDISGKLQDRM